MPTKQTTTRTTTSRAKKDERLLVTGAPMLDKTTMQGLAAEVHGKLFSERGRYFQVISVRVSGHKVYGHVQEMEEQGYMFSPVERSRNQASVFQGELFEK